MTALSLHHGTTHVCKNLENPVRDLNFVRKVEPHDLRVGLTQSFAFGGTTPRWYCAAIRRGVSGGKGQGGRPSPSFRPDWRFSTTSPLPPGGQRVRAVGPHPHPFSRREKGEGSEPLRAVRALVHSGSVKPLTKDRDEGRAPGMARLRFSRWRPHRQPGSPPPWSVPSGCG